MKITSFRSCFIAFFILISTALDAQVTLYRDTLVKVIVAGNEMNNGWSCGLNSPVFASIDLNGDGKNDFLVFDAQTYRLNAFENVGTGGTPNYKYAPEYLSVCPDGLQGWIRTYDYDNDGDMDLFSYNNGGIRVDRNDINAGNGLHFTNVSMQLPSNYFGFQTNLYSTRVDAPALVDIDNDGDMDVMGFSISGSWIELNKNLAMDSLGNANQFLFYNVPGCWGYFYKEASKNNAVLPVNATCPLLPAHPFRLSEENQIMDSGSSIWAIDLDGDGDKDFLCGDKVGRNLLEVQNCGNIDSAYACAQDTLFPSYNTPASMRDIAAPQCLDVDNDGVVDLLVTNYNNNGEDYNNVFYYRNIGSNNNVQFSLTQNRFLVNEMIEVGTSAHPVFFDWDSDGKKDLLISNDSYFDNGNSVSKVAYYRNTSVGSKYTFTLMNDSALNFRTYGLIGTRLAFGDLNGDGDEDLLVGDADGKLAYFQNIAGAGQTAIFIFSQAFFQNIDVGNDAAPQLVDVDRDGLLDLVIGERNGNLNYYRNTGSTSFPVFTFQTATFGNVDVKRSGGNAGYSYPVLFDNGSGYELLVGSYSGYIYNYSNIDGNLGGAFTLVDSSYKNLYEPLKSSPAMADIDGDGAFDLVIGNQSGGVVLYTQNSLNSIGENLVSELNAKIYPNPIKDYVTLEIDKEISDGKVQLTIYDLSGKEILANALASQTSTINTSTISSGFYTMILSHKKGRKMFKLIKTD